MNFFALIRQGEIWFCNFCDGVPYPGHSSASVISASGGGGNVSFLSLPPPCTPGMCYQALIIAATREECRGLFSL